MIKIAINGFGRIGRLAFRRMMHNNAFEIVAVNDLSDPSMLAYLLKYDSVHGRLTDDIRHSDNAIVVNSKTVKVYSEKTPQNLPWKNDNIDIVLECTGIFEKREKASAHLTAGARKVIVSAPSDKDVKTIVYNVNHNLLQASDQLISCASCTTNGLAPMAKALNDNFGIESGLMTTIHAYTNSQPLMDTPDPKVNYRKSRAAADSIVPYTTGAAKAIGLVIPELSGKLDGMSQRIPVNVGSIVELFTILNKPATAETVNAVMKAAANESYGYNEEPIVSTDIVGMSYGSLFDATQTKVIGSEGKQMVKTAAWYDNEMSFVAQLIRTAEYFGNLK